MDIKDNVVNLSTLKVVSDNIKSGISQWDDITSSITWTDTTTYPTGSYSDGTIGYATYAPSNYSIKVAQFSVVAGDEFILTGKRNINYDNMNYIAWFSTTSPINFGQLYEYMADSTEVSNIKIFKKKIVIPFNGTLKIYDYRLESSSGTSKYTRIEKRR